MSRILQPQTFLVGVTVPDLQGIKEYLRHTDQEEYLAEFEDGLERHGPIALCSLYAKLCYKSLVAGKNANITKTRDTQGNVEGCFDHRHGAVFEHVGLNFVTTNCSRVFTHELVRHRVGTAFSQTSGRYVALEDIKLVLPPELQDAYLNDPTIHAAVEQQIRATETLAEILRQKLIPEDADFSVKKKFTSAIRRFAPNGQTNEIGWSVNIRSLRHTLGLRTSRHAEWEIRHVFADVAEIISKRWPLMLYGKAVETVDNLPEYSFPETR